MAESSTTQLQAYLDRMNAGDSAARDELIRRACERLRRLTGKMLQDFRRLQRWEETDDVLQSAMVRLLQALRVVQPGSVAQFFRLAASAIRRELIDLARHYYGPQGPAAQHASNLGPGGPATDAPPYDRPESTYEPSRLARWTEFHRQVESLPEEERTVFDLLWYQGLTQAEAAAVLNVSEPTLRRRWRSARLHLHQTLGGEAWGAGPTV
jgi:RNA polymerase sigma-70 factor (ECF subfamily)